MKNSKNIIIIALASHGEGISGGDRIYIEFARQWAETTQVTIITWQEGFNMCQRSELKENTNLNFEVIDLNFFDNKGFFVSYMARIFYGIKWAAANANSLKKQTIIYSASDFWMDSIPALILKIKNRAVVWAASWYQTAPNPLKGFNSENRQSGYRVSAFLYWLVQLPVKPLIKKFADFVLVNNDLEQDQFPELKNKNRTVVVYGGVDINKIKTYLKKYKSVGRKYDAVFQGRFHPQKGVVELVQIWKLVTERIPQANLVMIGDGPLKNLVEEKIKELNLTKNIFLQGYLLDGQKKYQIFSRSKLVLHPSFYDSGGMASAEAMAFGIPCIGFDLAAYKSYYPKGMLKVKIGDLEAFSGQIVKLIQNPKMCKEIGKQAQSDVNLNWSWSKRANDVLTKILDK